MFLFWGWDLKVCQAAAYSTTGPFKNVFNFFWIVYHSACRLETKEIILTDPSELIYLSVELCLLGHLRLFRAHNTPINRVSPASGKL